MRTYWENQRTVRDNYIKENLTDLASGVLEVIGWLVVFKVNAAHCRIADTITDDCIALFEAKTFKQDKEAVT